MEQDNFVNDLAESIQLIKKEVDALQITIMSQKTPWYKNISTTLSILALLFSFGTTYVSYKRTEAQDIQSARVELRGLLQRLSYLPRDNFETSKKYLNDPGAMGTIGGLINQENALLSRQAAELARKLPKNYVSATEYYSIAQALQAAYNVEGAKEFLGYALESAKDFNDKIAALRSNANLMFITGKPEAGRVEYQKALNIFSGYGEYDDYTKKSTHIWTELSWAYSEANAGFKDLANQHIDSAQSYLSGLQPSPGADQLMGQINQAKAQLNSTRSLTNSSDNANLPQLMDDLKRRVVK
ncbi:MAG: hypothetical protein LC785_06080 [Acidobacteria bacterium]|nr:hypothetical protein [Acidobacteriota bacterium]MCA1641514.1 hypothetical protein [Acidobacteriota bacterium]